MERSKSNTRWLVLLLSSIFMFGNYYCYDNPSAIKSQLQLRFSNMPLSTFEMLFGLMYSVYSVPNIVLPFFGGFLVDKFGLRKTLLSYCSCIFVGQVVVALGCSYRSFFTLLLGRMIFGLGGESLGVAQSTLLASWFNKNEIAFALGLSNSIGTMGSVLNNELGPHIAEITNVSYTLWFGVILTELALIASILVANIERKVEQQERIFYRHKETEREAIHFTDVFFFRFSFWLMAICGLVIYGCILPFNNVASSLLLERDYFKVPPTECTRCGVGAYSLDKTNCTVIADKCPIEIHYAWPLPLISKDCIVINPEDQLDCSTKAPWIEAETIMCDEYAWKVGPKTSRYCERKIVASEAAANAMSIPYSLSVLLCPLLGIFVDRYGMKALMLLLSPLISTCAHLLLAWTKINVWFPMILQGIAYSIFAAALWPSIPLLVDENHVGTAYGVVEAFVNAGLSVFPIIVATVYDINGTKYIPAVENLFAIIGFIGILTGILLNYNDFRNGWLLNKPRHREEEQEDDPSEYANLVALSNIVKI